MPAFFFFFLNPKLAAPRWTIAASAEHAGAVQGHRRGASQPEARPSAAAGAAPLPPLGHRGSEFTASVSVRWLPSF